MAVLDSMISVYKFHYKGFCQRLRRITTLSNQHQLQETMVHHTGGHKGLGGAMGWERDVAKERCDVPCPTCQEVS